MTNYDKLLAKLTEIFQLDQADLDFGIYRIMNSKRDEILRFLDKDLLPQVKEVLAKAQGDIGSAGSDELKQAEDQARALGMDPDTVPKVLELRAKYAGGGDLGVLEQEVFNHLYNFFRRYYDEGDFLSLRRYKEGVYAIPYEGEEVKLHWANADQYYIKTAEHFRDYTFKIGERRVHLKLVDAEAEPENNKESEKRVFILADGNPVAEEDGDLVLRFEYRNDPAKRKQRDLSEAAEKLILAMVPAHWHAALTAMVSAEKAPGRTLLTKYLSSYTARNTFDYFIHKDLGGFLRRELDFYVKNEVMHLDDIENESAPKVEQYLAKIRAIRRVASKIIDFLAQIEDFQKRLWLKKKFVVDTQYLITLNRVPAELYPDVIANGAQREEWAKLLNLADINGNLTDAPYSVPLTHEFLIQRDSLPLNTAHFSTEFKNRLLRHITNLDEAVGGYLVKADCFHALHLAQARLRDIAQCAYLDPPYNTNTDTFLYKDSYRHASWMSMIADRLRLTRHMLSKRGALMVSIDENEVRNLHAIICQIFDAANYVTDLVWQGSSKNDQKYFSISHEVSPQ